MENSPLVLVTGAARRMGRHIALHLAEQGWDVAVHFRQHEEDAQAVVREIEARGRQARAFAADLACESQCEALPKQVLQHMGRLDAVVNNASTFEYDSVATFSYGAMERHWRANTAPAVVLARALFDHLATRPASFEIEDAGVGAVVNVLDQKLWNLNPDHFSYTLSKAALHTATRMLAQALAPRVRVSAVAPGLTLPSGPMSEAQFEAAHRLSPLGRSSTVEDIARAVAFLLRAPAITGDCLLVDGGQHLQPQARDVFFLVQPAAKA
jgi:NAD(P)-dependent dehydrogenase (short-subunit alcohol dehydrogenase family)